MNEMKAYIPDAIRFIEDYENSLNILLELQAKTTDKHYEFHKSGGYERAIVEEYRDEELWLTDKVSDTSLEIFIFRNEEFSEEEKEAILEALTVLDELNDSVVVIDISPISLEIRYKRIEHNWNGTSVEMYLQNYQREQRGSPSYRGVHQEQLSDIWWVAIYFNHRI